MDSIIKTGIIGFGLSGRVFHAPFLHLHPGFELAAVVERHGERSKKIYPYVGLLKNYRALLADKAIQLVVIATPNGLHYPMAAECLAAGKDIVIEKPFTNSVKEAEELIELAAKHGKKIFVYHNRRFDADFLTIQKLLQTGSLGSITYYEAHFDRFSPKIKPNAWRDKKLPGSGILFDLGPHLIDQALALFGMPHSIRARLSAEREGSCVDDQFEIELFYPHHSALLKAGMMVKDPGPRYLIRGTKAIFSKYGIDPQEARLKAGEMPGDVNWGEEEQQYLGTLIPVGHDQQGGIKVPGEKGNYMKFYQNVFDVLSGKNIPMLITAEEARNVIFIIEKAFESHDMNTRLSIK
jgi:scyllo-inositol 2-dehydrogenase (NADP+)